METKKNQNSRKTYKSPLIECIKLDNEISLALESEMPPVGPDESKNSITPEYFNNDPFKNQNT